VVAAARPAPPPRLEAAPSSRVPYGTTGCPAPRTTTGNTASCHRAEAPCLPRGCQTRRRRHRAAASRAGVAVRHCRCCCSQWVVATGRLSFMPCLPRRSELHPVLLGRLGHAAAVLSSLQQRRRHGCRPPPPRASQGARSSHGMLCTSLLPPRSHPETMRYNGTTAPSGLGRRLCASARLPARRHLRTNSSVSRPIGGTLHE